VSERLALVRADRKLRSNFVTKNPLSRKTLLMISLRPSPMLLRFAFVAAVSVRPIAHSQAAVEPRKPDGDVPESLDQGKLGIERKLYCRELIARFSHEL